MTKYLNTKPGSVEEVAANMSKYQSEGDYQKMFKKELEKAGKGIGAMSPKEKKDFFNKIDSKYKAKDENKEVKEGFASDAQRKAAFASGYKAKGDKKETHSFMTKKMNQSQKDAPGEKEPMKMKEADQHGDEINAKKVKAAMTKGEKEIVDPAPKMKAENHFDSIKSVWQMSAEELEKIKNEAKYMKANRMKQYSSKEEEDEKKKEKLMADTGSKKTEVDVEPKVDYKN